MRFQKIVQCERSLRVRHRKAIVQIIRKIFCSINYFPFFDISLCCSLVSLCSFQKSLFHG